MLLLLIFLQITFFLSNVAALSITVQSTTIVGQPSLVLWARQPSDGNGLLVFDLRFVHPGPERVDVGLALANIQAPPLTQFGTVQVVFPSPRSYQLVAVTGPDDTSLGASGEVDAYQVPISIPTRSSTSQSIPSATTSTHPTSTPSAARRTKNLGAIIGGTLGGITLLGLLAALMIVFLRRRRQSTENKRWTLHRDLRILPPVLDIRHISPTIKISLPVSSPEDIEQGLPHDDSEAPTSPIVMMASPSGPRPLLKPFYRPLPIPPGPLKPRQEEIVAQMEQLRNQMMELEKNAGPIQHIILDDMQKQMSWLHSQIGSAWAMELTDVEPLGFGHNLEKRISSL